MLQQLLLFPFDAYTLAWHNGTLASPCLSNVGLMSETFAVNNKPSVTSSELGLLGIRCLSIVSCSNTRNVLQSGCISILRWRRGWYLLWALRQQVDRRDSIYQLSLFGILDSFLDSCCCLSYDRSTASSIASSPHGAIQCFLIQFPPSTLFLKII